MKISVVRARQRTPSMRTPRPNSHRALTRAACRPKRPYLIEQRRCWGRPRVTLMQARAAPTARLSLPTRPVTSWESHMAPRPPVSMSIVIVHSGTLHRAMSQKRIKNWINSIDSASRLTLAFLRPQSTSPKSCKSKSSHSVHTIWRKAQCSNNRPSQAHLLTRSNPYFSSASRMQRPRETII